MRAKFPNHTFTGGNDDIKAKNGMMNTVLGLLAKGDMNCAGGNLDANQDLFAQQKPATTETADQRPARKPNEVPEGVVRTEAEKQKAEEEARLQREKEEREQREREEAEAAERERIRRENSKWTKFKKGAMRFVKGMVEEEE